MQRVTPRAIQRAPEDLFGEDSVSGRLRGAVHHARTSTTMVNPSQAVDLKEIYNRKSSNNVGGHQIDLQNQAAQLSKPGKLPVANSEEINSKTAVGKPPINIKHGDRER